jgi:hypothetical protein
LLAHGRWFSPGTPASFTTKTGRHDITEILLKVALKHQKSINQNQLNQLIKDLSCNRKIYIKNTAVMLYLCRIVI